MSGRVKKTSEEKEREREEMEKRIADRMLKAEINKIKKRLDKAGEQYQPANPVDSITYNDRLIGRTTVDSLKAVARLRVARGLVLKYAYQEAKKEEPGASVARTRQLVGDIVKEVYNGTEADGFMRYYKVQMNTAEFKDKVEVRLCQMRNKAALTRIKNEYLKYNKCNKSYSNVVRRTENVYTLDEAKNLVKRVIAGDNDALQDFDTFQNSRKSKKLFGYDPRDIPGYEEAVGYAKAMKSRVGDVEDVEDIVPEPAPRRSARRPPLAVDRPRRKPSKRGREDDDEERPAKKSKTQ